MRRQTRQGRDRPAGREGVEDRLAWETLADLGCDVAQGYYISPPLGVDDLDRWLRVSLWAKRKPAS